MKVLPLADDDLAKCVSCGLCLPHCPTYRVTGEEALSPRGRITAMRAVEDGSPIGAAFAEIMETCVVCRACETACPSAVPFGRLMEASRQVLEVPRWQRLGYAVLEHPRLLRALTKAGAVAQLLHLAPRRLALPRLPFRQKPLGATGDDVWLFTGCVMDAWQRDVHRATIAVLDAMGVGVALPGPGAACCGALHAHAGLHDRYAALSRRVVESFPGSAPIVVNSAGCGAAMKEYRSPEFASRVFDVQEWIASRASLLPAPPPSARRLRIAVQDPCHLRHVQRVEQSVRTVLEPYGDLVELADEGRCCGAGGAYSALRPKLAGAIRDQKVAEIKRAGADVVASANPGCAMWLADAGLRVLHPMEIVATTAGLA